ncbi:MAG: membrane integrity-associated transporter subunit PqiC [Myxococcales bacterium]|nr:membrane integrity-associated transporter subunit PqiC [Myxococcales bacterium]
MTKPNTANRMGLLLIGVGLSLTLWSCASGPAPIDHYYRIDAGVPDAPAARRLQGNLQVDRLRADALTGERQLLYKETADASEIRQHPYQRWSDPPAILLQTELISFLSAAAAADTVMSATARVKPDYVVSGRIRDFERVLEPKVRAVVEIQLVVTSATGGEILVNHSYREEQAAANSTIAASVVAFSEAVHIIFERFLADLGGS